MSIHGPNRRRSISAARDSHRRDTDRPITKADINEFKHMIRQERKDKKRSKRLPGKRPGSDRDRAERELALRPTLALNERQQALYDLLTDHPQRPCDLRRALELTDGQLGAAMGGLTARGVAIRTAKGWRRDTPP